MRKFARLTVLSSTAQPLLNVSVYAHASCVHNARPSCDGLAVPVNRAVLCTEQKGGWQLLLRRFRSLRATLVSQGNVSLFAVRVYLLSTDVSLCAPDHTECLKGLQPLVCQLFPVFSHQQQRYQSQTFLESSKNSVDTEVCTSCHFQLFHYICRRNAQSCLAAPTILLLLQTCRDWGKESWLDSAAESDSADTDSVLSQQTASTDQCDGNDKHLLENGQCIIRLHLLWAYYAGLLVLYFACLPQTNQVHSIPCLPHTILLQAALSMLYLCCVE